MSDEKTFLSNYNMNDYERPSVTADIIAFMIRSQESGNYRFCLLNAEVTRSRAVGRCPADF